MAQRVAGRRFCADSAFIHVVVLAALVTSLAPALAVSAGAQECVSFAVSPPYGAGQGAFSIAAGDFNEDGRLDLAVGNYYADSVSVLLADGAGGFEAAVTLAVGKRPWDVAVGDLNGDGHSDLVVGNSESDTVSVLIGDGAGRFDSRTDYAVAGLSSVVARDLNGDGRADVAVAGYDTGTVSVFLNTGDGVLGPRTDYAAGAGPTGMSAADFNEDRYPDLVVTNWDSGTTSVLLSTGAGTYGPKTDYSTPGWPGSVAVGDFNADGRSDFIVGTDDYGTISVFLGTGTGGFARSDYVIHDGTMSLEVGDFNRDRRLDLVIAWAGSPGSVSLLPGNGDGTFGPRMDFPTNDRSDDVVAGAFDADGGLDLAVVDFRPDRNGSVNVVHYTGTCGVLLEVSRAGAGGGSVTSSPGGIECGSRCAELYTYRDTVTLTAEAAAGSTFTGWNGAGCSGTGACAVTMDVAKSVTATFDACSYAIDGTSASVAASGGSGSVSLTASGAACPWTAVSSDASWLTVTTASGGSGSATVAYSVAANAGAVRSGTLTIAGQTYSVSQAKGTATLVVTKVGSGSGVVASSPAGIDCGAGCSVEWPLGTTVTLDATAAAGALFSGWSEAGCGVAPSCSLVLNSDQSVSATFGLVPPSIQFGAGTYSVGEAGATATIVVTRSFDPTSPVTVDYATSDATAAAGLDYAAASGTLTFGAFETSKTLTVEIVDDALVEANETVNLALSNPSGGAALGAQATAELTIVEDDAAAPTMESVVWSEASGVTASGNILTKTAPEGWGNASASSTRAIASGDGYVEFAATETDSTRVVGLSRGVTPSSAAPNSSAARGVLASGGSVTWSIVAPASAAASTGYDSIEFALVANADATLAVYERGQSRGSGWTYASGDRLRVSVTGGVVSYSRNDDVLYSSSQAPTYPLLAEVALYDSGATVQDVVIFGSLTDVAPPNSRTEAVTWTGARGVAVSGNNLRKTAASGWGNGGAVSTRAITSGNGHVELTISETSTARMLGLSSGHANARYGDIDFAVLLSANGVLRAVERGLVRGRPQRYVAGDVIRVAVADGIVSCSRNGRVFYTSTRTPKYPLRVEATLFHRGATLNNVVISGSLP